MGMCMVPGPDAAGLQGPHFENLKDHIVYHLNPQYRLMCKSRCGKLQRVFA